MKKCKQTRSLHNYWLVFHQVILRMKSQIEDSTLQQMFLNEFKENLLMKFHKELNKFTQLKAIYAVLKWLNKELYFTAQVYLMMSNLNISALTVNMLISKITIKRENMMNLNTLQLTVIINFNKISLKRTSDWQEWCQKNNTCFKCNTLNYSCFKCFEKSTLNQSLKK